MTIIHIKIFSFTAALKIESAEINKQISKYFFLIEKNRVSEVISGPSFLILAGDGLKLLLPSWSLVNLVLGSPYPPPTPAPPWGKVLDRSQQAQSLLPTSVAGVINNGQN